MHRALGALETQPEVKARHLALAAASADEEIFTALDQAADAARARGAPAAAAELVDLAIGLGGDTPLRRIKSAENHFLAGNTAQAGTVIRVAAETMEPGILRSLASSQLATVLMYQNEHDEAVELLHQPEAHTSGDIMVYFRKSDVIAAGDVYINTTFPVIDREHGGSYAGILAALNRIIDITVPRDKEEGGTYVIPGHGRLADEADVVDYRDMATIVRDRVRDAIGRKMSLEQMKAARLVRDYEGRFGASQGTWTTDAFIEAAYRSLSPARPAAGAR